MLGKNKGVPHGTLSNKKVKVPRVKKPMTVRRAIITTVVSMLGVFVVVGGVVYYSKVYVPPIQEIDYALSGRNPLDSLERELNNLDVKSGTKLVSLEDSWVLKEIEYANGSKMRQDFIKTVLSNIKFEYPNVQASNSRGLMFDKIGNPIMVESPMVSGESTYVNHIDYNALASKMQDDRDKILKMLAEKGYKPTDYTYQDEMIDLMLEYIGTIEKLPMVSTEINIPLRNEQIQSVDKKGRPVYTDKYIVTDDIELDKVLFSSNDFHRMCDSFSMVITGWKPNITQQEQDNPEYAVYQRGIADGTISADTKAPDKKVMVNIVDGESFPTEEVIHYRWLGSYYLQNEYSKDKPIMPQVGDGTFEKPAGIDTSIITKAIGSDGLAHDIRIELNTVLRDQEAIDYLSKFSEQNRGFIVAGALKLICFEYTVTNLETAPITITDDLVLCDKNSDQSSKTGSIFGLTESVTLKQGESAVMQNWGTSTEMDRKYLIWGKSFNRNYPSVWFKVLAGDVTSTDKDKVVQDEVVDEVQK